MTSVGLAFQRKITRIALSKLGGHGFALAGSGAVREHGITQRPTEDIDLFRVGAQEGIASAIEELLAILADHGYQCEVVRRSPSFARVAVLDPKGGRQVTIDLGTDWRALPPTSTEIGPVLSLADAVGNKIAALYSRSAPRDFLDVDAIRRAGVFEDAELLAAAAQRDPGFDVARFAQQLALIKHVHPGRVEQYGVSAEELAGVRSRLLTWAAALLASD